jgi:hypothetical protein
VSESYERAAWFCAGFIPAGSGMRAEFEHSDCIDVFYVSRKNEDILGVHGDGGEGQRNMKIRASKSVYLSLYV